MISDEPWASLANAVRTVRARPFAVYGYDRNGDLFAGWGIEITGSVADEGATLFTIPGSHAVESADTADQILAGYQHGTGRAVRLLWLDEPTVEGDDMGEPKTQSETERLIDELAADETGDHTGTTGPAGPQS